MLPTENEMRYARTIHPHLDYAVLAAKMAKVACVVADGPLEPMPPTPVIRCKNSSCGAGDSALVYDSASADTVCTACGMVAVQQDSNAWDTYTPVNVPLYSEPIAGHVRAQNKCDFYSGTCGTSTSKHTKYMDAQHAREWYSCKFPSGVALHAHRLYTKYRDLTEHVQQRDVVLMACALLAARSVSSAT